MAAPEANHDHSAAWFAEHYTKYEHRIPMRDGVRLFTRVYVPRDDSDATWPILLTRTPYSLKPYGVDHFHDPRGSFEQLAGDRFIMVTQDVRGRHGSEGEFDEMRPYRPHKSGPQDTDESTDAWDTIDWLVKNTPNNNGAAGLFGISYPGFYTSMGMIDSHPALKAASPQAPVADLFQGDDVAHNGAFCLAANFGFAYFFDQKLEDPLRDRPRGFEFRTPDGYDFFLRLGPLSNVNRLYFHDQMPTWNLTQEHPSYDAFWQARNIRPHLKNIRCAVMTVGGWFDAEDLMGTLETYRWTERQNPGITNLLVMGPWVHGGWAGGDGDGIGDVDFRSSTAEFYRDHIELPFFRYFLKGDTNFTPIEARVFETGTHRWRRFETWPPSEVTRRALYFEAGGRLSRQQPAGGDDAFDEFTSDPARPVPHINRITTGYSADYMVADQRFATSRPDVLVYQTDPLEEDFTIAGPIEVSSHVSTTGTDADFVVKLIDVYPGDFPDPDPNPAEVRMGGYQQLVRGEPFRGRFRRSFEHPEPFEPGKVEVIHFGMPDVLHTFRRGHRVMVHVQSSWFPLIDRNPQTFVNIPTAVSEDFRKADHRVHRSGRAPSAIMVGVLPR
jgi:putative CocE/NonD family hydrolase